MTVVITLTILYTSPVVLSPPPKTGSRDKTEDITRGPRAYEDIDYSWGFLERTGQASKLAHLASMKRLWFLLWLTVVPGRGFLYVCQGLRDLNFPTGAQGRKRKHLDFLTSLPDVGQRESRGMGPVRKETCKLSAIKYQNWSQMLYYTDVNSSVITVLVHTYSWDSEEMGF